LFEKQSIDRDQHNIKPVQIDDSGTGQQFPVHQIERATIQALLVVFREENRQAVGAADNRAGFVKQTSVIVKERTALSCGALPHMTADGCGLLVGQGHQSLPECRALHGEDGDGRAAVTAPFGAGDLILQRMFNAGAEFIHPGYQLPVIVECVLNDSPLFLIAFTGKTPCFTWQMLRLSVSVIELHHIDGITRYNTLSLEEIRKCLVIMTTGKEHHT